MIQIDISAPKNCYDCPFNQGEYGPDCYEKHRCVLTGKSMEKKNYKGRRPSNCPIREIADNSNSNKTNA